MAGFIIAADGIGIASTVGVWNEMARHCSFSSFTVPRFIAVVVGGETAW
jgi:hypothetical protein